MPQHVCQTDTPATQSITGGSSSDGASAGLTQTLAPARPLPPQEQGSTRPLQCDGHPGGLVSGFVQDREGPRGFRCSWLRSHRLLSLGSSSPPPWARWAGSARSLGDTQVASVGPAEGCEVSLAEVHGQEGARGAALAPGPSGKGSPLPISLPPVCPPTQGGSLLLPPPGRAPGWQPGLLRGRLLVPIGENLQK